jgi:hypothetical protein
MLLKCQKAVFGGLVKVVTAGRRCDGEYNCVRSDDYGLCYKGLRPDKNWFMLSLKFPRQKIVKGDFLNRDGDFRA